MILNTLALATSRNEIATIYREREIEMFSAYFALDETKNNNFEKKFGQ